MLVFHWIRNALLALALALALTLALAIAIGRRRGRFSFEFNLRRYGYRLPILNNFYPNQIFIRLGYFCRFLFGFTVNGKINKKTKTPDKNTPHRQESADWIEPANPIPFPTRG